MEFSKKTRIIFSVLSGAFKFLMLSVIFMYGYFTYVSQEFISDFSIYIYFILFFMVLHFVFKIISQSQDSFLLKIRTFFLKIHIILFIFSIFMFTFLIYSEDFVHSIQPSIDSIVVQATSSSDLNGDNGFEDLGNFFEKEQRISFYLTSNLSQKQVETLSLLFHFTGKYEEQKKKSSLFVRTLHDQIQIMNASQLNLPLPLKEIAKQYDSSDVDLNDLVSLPLGDSLSVGLYFLEEGAITGNLDENLRVLREDCKLIVVNKFCEGMLVTEYDTLLANLAEEYPEYSEIFGKIDSIDNLNFYMKNKKSTAYILLTISLLSLIFSFYLDTRYREKKEIGMAIFLKDYGKFFSLQLVFTLISTGIMYILIKDEYLENFISSILSTLQIPFQFSLSKLLMFTVLLELFSSLFITFFILLCIFVALYFFEKQNVVSEKKESFDKKKFKI